MTLPVHVINLDRRPDRWALMSDQLSRLGIEPERIPGVDARLLAAQEEWEGRTNHNPPFWRINLGAAAGMLGHAKAMTALLRSDAPAALILEDDAELTSDVGGLLESTDWWPVGAKAVRLEEHFPSGRKWRQIAPLWHSSGKTPGGRELRRLERWCSGSAAYLVSREGARIALAAFSDPTETVDHTLFDLRVSSTARRLRTVQVVPAMARQRRDDTSDQQHWREAAEPTGTKRRKVRLLRNLRSLPHKARVRALLVSGRVERVKVAYSTNPHTSN